MIDTHTHFYDPTRPLGVPWPDKGSPLYRTVLPMHYRQMPQPLPVAGTVVVEASVWLEDNQWILDLAEREPFIVGFVGHLTPGEDKFRDHLARFARNRVFRGIRVGGDKSLTEGLGRPDFIAGLRLLAEKNLSLDVVGGAGLLALVPRLAAAAPDLRIIIDHMGGVRVAGPQPEEKWTAAMRTMIFLKNVFLKVSGCVEGTGKRDGTAPTEMEYYRPYLEVAWEAFGEDRLIYGSNWPVSELFAPCHVVQGITRDYFQTKGPAALAKVFSRNAQVAYQWRARS